MLKFRTMVDGADAAKGPTCSSCNEADGLFKIAEDPRITPVGASCAAPRSTSCHSCSTCCAGEMSLVGPRPLVPEEDAGHRGLAGAGACTSRPGMTGLWQIFGSSRIPMREMVKIDYLYGANWWLWLDVKIAEDHPVRIGAPRALGTFPPVTALA